MTIFRFALIRSLRKKSTLVSLVVTPPAMIFLRPLWVVDDGIGFSFYGLLLMIAAFSLVRLVMADRVAGTAVRIFAAPVTTLRYLSQNLLAFLLILGAQTGLMIIAGVALYRWEAGMASLLALSYIVFTASAIAFSLAWNSLFRSKATADGIFSLVASFMALLGGIFIPISIMPEILQKIGMIFPTYWLSNSLLFLQSRGSDGEYWFSILIMFLFSTAFLLYGSKRRLE